jgi:hypothetical protein
VSDPLSVADLVHDELRQRRESGHKVSALGDNESSAG